MTIPDSTDTKNSSGFMKFVVVRHLFLFLLTFCSLLSFAQPTEEVFKGEKLYKGQCASCHKLEGKLVGPALSGVRQRWIDAGEYQGKTGEQWLYEWIKNSPGTIKSGYPYAVSMSNYDASVMQVFGNLKDEDIKAILAYIDNPPVKTTAVAPSGTPGSDVKEAPSHDMQYILYVLVSVLIVIVLILGRITSSLNKLALEKDGLPVPPDVPFYKTKFFVTSFILLILVLAGNKVVNSAIDLGRQQGYAPDQPIKFSHEIHAGIDKIDCQYCHNGAAESKHSNIPSVNTCMNCHKAISGDGAKYAKNGRKEISKIYAAVGFNPVDGKYWENYESVPTDEVRAVFTKWLEEDPTKKHGVASMNEVLNQIQKPVEWVRIHNLPDHVYFNHAQHVTVGKLECQTCHGEVEKMEVLAQHSPLSMGWCISCHRNNEVNFAGNEYYKIYEAYQADLKAGNISKVTVEKLGGTECQKCHY